MNNMINYDWQQLLTCADMFPNLHSLQVAFNSLRTLGPVPVGSLSQLRLLDVGANPLRDFSELWHLSQLPRLEELNINSCELPCVKFEDDGCQHSTQHFKSLTSLYIANNPLDNWKSVCQLSRLASLENLTFGLQIKADDYFPEFIYAIIRTLKMLNRTQVTVKEKRDYELFYLKKFSCPYYDAGGSENPTSDTVLNQDFVQEHPTFLQLAIDIGAPFDERGHRDKSQAPLKDQMLKVSILLPDGDRLERTLLPSVKISRLKMMLRRSLKLPHSAKLKLSYTPKKSCRDEKNIPLDCDYKDVGFFSLGDGDTIHLSW
uniref:Tubulin-specific chaperone E-like n=2 Tax=Hirondellea gigas TaxID=1518452 RepID=A0A6A7FSE4_9CRUS